MNQIPAKYQVQYIGLMKPVMDPPADPPPLAHIGWFVPLSEPVRRLPRPVDVGWYTRSPETFFLPVVVGSWYMPLSEPARTVRSAVPEGLYVKPIDPSLLTTPTHSTLTQTPDPVRRQRRPVDEGGSQTIFLAAWYFAPDPTHQFRQVPDVIRRPPAPVQTGFQVHPLEQSLVVPPLMWFARASEPTRRPSVPLNEGGRVGPLETHLVESPLAWLQKLSEPVRTTPRAIDAPTWLPKPFAVTPDWQALPTLPVRRPALRPEGGTFAPPIYVTLPLIGWHTPQSEPLRRSKPLTPGGSVNLGFPLPGDPLNIVPIHWYRQTVGPVLRAAPTVNRRGGAYVPEPEGVGVEFPDKWQVRAEIPVRRRPFRGEGGAPVAFIVVTQEWMPPLQQPVLKARHTHREVGAFVEHQPAAQKWFQPAAVPMRRVRRAIPTEAPRFDPSLFVAPPGIGWYTPLSVPVRRVPRTHSGYEQLLFFRPVAADRGNVEAGQIWTPHIEAGQVFTPHVDEGQLFTPHVEAAQVE